MHQTNAKPSVVESVIGSVSVSSTIKSARWGSQESYMPIAKCIHGRLTLCFGCSFFFEERMFCLDLEFVEQYAEGNEQSTGFFFPSKRSYLQIQDPKTKLNPRKNLACGIVR